MAQLLRIPRLAGGRRDDNRSGDSRTMQRSKQNSICDRPFHKHARAILRDRLLWKVNRIAPLMNAIIDDINCRFLAVFEKLSVVFMAQHFNVYSPTVASRLLQCLQD
jgi:hypothetical protein